MDDEYEATFSRLCSMSNVEMTNDEKMWRELKKVHKSRANPIHRKKAGRPSKEEWEKVPFRRASMIDLIKRSPEFKSKGDAYIVKKLRQRSTTNTIEEFLGFKKGEHSDLVHEIRELFGAKVKAESRLPDLSKHRTKMKRVRATLSEVNKFRRRIGTENLFKALRQTPVRKTK